jgi:hypothetical protein
MCENLRAKRERKRMKTTTTLLFSSKLEKLYKGGRDIESSQVLFHRTAKESAIFLHEIAKLSSQSH